MTKKGYLVISLDFELVWGVFDVVNLKSKKKYFENTKIVIPEILDLFRANNIHATWATVGMLFNKNWEDWKINTPRELPKYANSSLSAYEFGNSNVNKDYLTPFFALDIIKQIFNTEGQELGTHTYSHYYCQEESQTAEQFKQDLTLAIKLADRNSVKLKSLVFPRNQLKQEYLKICKEHGILNVRSNPTDWYWNSPKSNSLITKVARTADAYLNLGDKSYKLEELRTDPDCPLEQPASRFLRPVEANNTLRKLKLERIKKEMTLAAKKNRIYHLWWHPHNFGDNPIESLKDLKLIINHFNYLNKEYNYRSVNMAEIGELANN